MIEVLKATNKWEAEKYKEKPKKAPKRLRITGKNLIEGDKNSASNKL